VSQHPFSVEECTVGTGATCGAIYLDEGFENLIRNIFRRVGIQKIEKKILGELLRSFQSQIKTQFDPMTPDALNEYEVAVPGIPDMPQIGLRDGYLALTK